jgi:regulator of sigma E protease
MLTIIAFVFVFSIIGFVHEFGHFILAKITGIKVEEFSLGFGPALIRRQVGETLYVMRLIPLGGFCKLAGQADDIFEPETADDVEQHKLFSNKPILTRMAVIAAGPVMNVILSIVLFVIIFSIVGTLMLYVAEVHPNSPAEQAGLQSGDMILSVNGYGPSPDEILMVISQSSGVKLRMEIIRDGERLTLTGTPVFDETENRALLQFTPGLILVKQGVWRTTEYSVRYGISIVRIVVTGIWNIFTGAVKPMVAGPIGMAEMAGEAARYGILDLLNFTAILSINLGLLNLLPVPLLDGGWLLFLIIEGIRRKPVKPEVKAFALRIGLALLLLLFIFATYSDLTRIFFT